MTLESTQFYSASLPIKRQPLNFAVSNGDPKKADDQNNELHHPLPVSSNSPPNDPPDDPTGNFKTNTTKARILKQADLNFELSSACCEGDLAEVIRLCKLGADPTHRDNFDGQECIR